MLRGELARVQETCTDATAAAAAIGAAAGVVTSVVSFLDVTPYEGPVGSLATNPVGLGIALVMSMVVGMLLGFFVGGCEGALAWVLADRVARRHRSLRSLGVGLAVGFGLVNLTLAAVVCGLAFGLDGSSGRELVSPLTAGALTLVAVAAFAWMQSWDWPSVPPSRVDVPVDLRGSSDTATGLGRRVPVFHGYADEEPLDDEPTRQIHVVP